MIADNPYAQRVETGKRIERSIIEALRKKGYKIEDPTPHQDMIDKIDGWWIGPQGGRYGVQIKYRQRYDDILYELIKDVDRRILGRDFRSTADVYLVANERGITRMYLLQPIKQKAIELKNLAEKDLAEDPKKDYWRGPGWDMHLLYDRAEKTKKVIAHFSPWLFDELKSWKLVFENSNSKYISKNSLKLIIEILVKKVMKELEDNNISEIHPHGRYAQQAGATPFETPQDY